MQEPGEAYIDYRHKFAKCREEASLCTNVHCQTTLKSFSKISEFLMKLENVNESEIQEVEKKSEKI